MYPVMAWDREKNARPLTRQKIEAEQAEKIKRCAALNPDMTQEALGRRFGVARGAVANILKRGKRDS